MSVRTPRSMIALTVFVASLSTATIARAQDAGATTGSGSAQVSQPGSQLAQPAPARPWLYNLRGGSYATGSMGFLGGRMSLPLADRVTFEGSGEWLFVHDVDRMFMVSADVHYALPTDAPLRPWIGTGIGIRHFAKGDGWPAEHSLGLNLLGGVDIPLSGSRLVPFVLGKVFLAGQTLFANDAEAVVMGGIRF